MNSYKELIDTLRDLTHGIVRISNGSVLREAADAIEILTAELAEERHRHDRLQDWDRGMTEKLTSAELQCKQINEGAAIVLKKCDAVLEELAQVKAERDAAVKCLEDAHACETCEHMDTHPECEVDCLRCKEDCQCRECRDGSNFKWKGTKEDTQWKTTS